MGIYILGDINLLDYIDYGPAFYAWAIGFTAAFLALFLSFVELGREIYARFRNAEKSTK